MFNDIEAREGTLHKKVFFIARVTNPFAGSKISHQAFWLNHLLYSGQDRSTGSRIQNHAGSWREPGI